MIVSSLLVADFCDEAGLKCWTSLRGIALIRRGNPCMPFVSYSAQVACTCSLQKLQKGVTCNISLFTPCAGCG